MKLSFLRTIAATAAISLCSAVQAFEANTQQISLDPAIRMGTLPNGLTYYIRHNEEPKDRAFFYIAQKVGSIQEEPDQRGLAHFLEHMCFNGTEHFPGKGLIQYLERIGVKFGADLNAYTAVDETVYNIDNVPASVPGAIDSCLLILHDWSHSLLLEPDEIDAERGVIQEEWRSRNSASQRINEAMMPHIFPGDKYADCMPIGNMDVVLNFPHDALRRYYQKWYRPDLQGIVIVGDVDVDDVEQRIRTTFADIPAPAADAAPRIYYPVSPNPEPIVFIGQDKEYGSPFVSLFFKHPALTRDERNTELLFLNGMLDNAISTMFHARLSEIAQRSDTPFGFGNGKNSGYSLSTTMDAFQAYVNCHTVGDGIERGYKAFLAELQRAVRHGFTDSEFERVKQDLRLTVESSWRNRDKRYSRALVNECVRHFLDNHAAPGIDWEYPYYQRLLSQVTVDDVNRRLRDCVEGRDLVISVSAPIRDDMQLPTEAQFLDWYRQSLQLDLEPYRDNVSDLPLLLSEPVPGRIVSRTVGADSIVHLTLSNGAHVDIQHTDYSATQVRLVAAAHGGASLLPDSLYKFTQLINMTTQVMGLGNYNRVQLTKALSGINAGVEIGLSDNLSTITASCTPEFVSNMMELTHAAFRYPNKDESAFRALTDRLARNYRESDKRPNRAYADSVNHALYGDSPYSTVLTDTDYDNASLDVLTEAYSQRFADASAFTFLLLGNVDEEAVTPFIEKYLASLPSTYSHETERPVKLVLDGTRICHFTKEQEQPKSSIAMYLKGHVEYNLHNYLAASILGQLLTMEYTATVREGAGAAYSVSAGASSHIYPAEEANIQIRFSTDPSKLDLAMRLVNEGLDKMKAGDASQENLDKCIEYMAKVYDGNRTVNAYWQNVWLNKWYSGLDLDTNYLDVLHSITLSDISEIARQILDSGNKVEVIMTSE